MEIASLANNKVKSARLLRERKFRQRSGELLLEGGRHIGEALAAGAHLGRCFYTAAAQSMWRPLLQELAAGDTELLCVSEKVMASLSDTVTPQGLVAVARVPESRGAAIFTCTDLILVADEIKDPGNLGTMLRTAAAVGAGLITTLASVDVTSPKVVRASAGALYNLALWIDADITAVMTAARQAEFDLAVCEASGTAAYYDLNLRRPTVIVIGNESQGPSDLWRGGVKMSSVHIPMPGRVESLNAAVAASVMLYEALRQRQSDSC